VREDLEENVQKLVGVSLLQQPSCETTRSQGQKRMGPSAASGARIQNDGNASPLLVRANHIHHLAIDDQKTRGDAASSLSFVSCRIPSISNSCWRRQQCVTAVSMNDPLRDKRWYKSYVAALDRGNDGGWEQPTPNMSGPKVNDPHCIDITPPKKEEVSFQSAAFLVALFYSVVDCMCSRC
jgi:hypothetical protein